MQTKTGILNHHELGVLVAPSRISRIAGAGCLSECHVPGQGTGSQEPGPDRHPGSWYRHASTSLASTRTRSPRPRHATWPKSTVLAHELWSLNSLPWENNRTLRIDPRLPEPSLRLDWLSAAVRECPSTRQGRLLGCLGDPAAPNLVRQAVRLAHGSWWLCANEAAAGLAAWKGPRGG